jgi:hypothetical protein
MKKIYLLATLFSFTLTGFAQYQYHPFPSQTGVWAYEKYSESYFYLGIERRVYVLDTADGYMKSSYGWYYEQNKEIYFKYDTGSFKLVYDFNLTVGDTFYVPNYNAPTGAPWQFYTTVILDDSNSVDWPGRRVIEFANGGQWVEGIGLVNDAWGIEYSFFQGSLSVAIVFACIAVDSVSYPCADAYVLASEENHLSADLKITPNPATAYINIELSLPGLQNTTATATVYNLAGQEVLRQELAIVSGVANLPLNEGARSLPAGRQGRFSSGSYVLELKTETHLFVEKILIK